MTSDLEAAAAPPEPAAAPQPEGLFASLRRDREAYRELGGWYQHPGFWVVAVFRFGAWVHGVRHPLLRLPLRLAYWLLKQPFRFVLHIEIPARTRIGGGLCLPHPFNIFIGDGAVLGRNCMIFHEVTIGQGPIPGLARLDDHVVLFPGARVLGGVSIGERSEVGANCVVTKDVPARSLVMPGASRVIPQALVRTGAVLGADVTDISCRIVQVLAA